MSLASICESAQSFSLGYHGYGIFEYSAQCVLQAAHPKNYCDVCGLMAEHAYIIKRHKMRHNSGGCECGVCGKKYKVR